MSLNGEERDVLVRQGVTPVALPFVARDIETLYFQRGCHGVEFTAPLSRLVEHGAVKPFFENEDTAEIGSKLITVLEDILLRNWLY